MTACFDTISSGTASKSLQTLSLAAFGVMGQKNRPLVLCYSKIVYTIAAACGGYAGGFAPPAPPRPRPKNSRNKKIHGSNWAVECGIIILYAIAVFCRGE